VHDQPEPPRQHARQLEPAQVHHRGHAADGGEVAEVAVAEHRRRLAGQLRADRGGDVRAHLLGRRRHPRYRVAVLHDAGEVPGDEHVQMSGHPEVRVDQHPAGAVALHVE